mgnify:CR=1 FL=1
MTNMIIIPARTGTIPRRHNNRKRVAGEQALLLAIISQAAQDYAHGNEEESENAASYFMSLAYQHHLELLDRQPNWLPSLVTEAINVTD